DIDLSFWGSCSMGPAGHHARGEEGVATMAIRAVVFDIGGVLEITPDVGVTRLWERRLGVPARELGARLPDVWAGGSIGTISEDGMHQAIRDRLGLDEHQLSAFMADLWREYLGTANTELGRVPWILIRCSSRTPAWMKSV